MAYLSRELATLKKDLPLDCATEQLVYEGAVRQRCDELFKELGFDNFLPFVTRWQS
jgi:hypothetical protein